MIISYDFGHGCGNDRGASGYLNEEKVIREYAPIAIKILESYGHKCVNCTPSGNMTLMQSLSYRTTHANASKSQLHICFHVNAFRTTSSAMGSEIEVASANGTKYGNAVLKQIVALGFKSRGIKYPSLYVTNHTNMVSFLIEPFFCDSKADCNLYNAQKLGLAVAKGVLSLIGGTAPKVVTKPVVVVKSNTGKIYRVVCGAYADEANADVQKAKLKVKGFESFIEIK